LPILVEVSFSAPLLPAKPLLFTRFFFWFQGNRTTPSYVAFTDTERLIGDAAKNQVAMNPTNTIFDAKRLIGRKFTDVTVQADMKHWPFTVRILIPASIEANFILPLLACSVLTFCVQCTSENRLSEYQKLRGRPSILSKFFY
jgi:hypothetical protein